MKYKIPKKDIILSKSIAQRKIIYTDRQIFKIIQYIDSAIYNFTIIDVKKLIKYMRILVISIYKLFSKKQ